MQGETLSLAVAGSGDIRVRRVEVASLQASVAGSGDIVAAGSAATVHPSRNSKPLTAGPAGIAAAPAPAPLRGVRPRRGRRRGRPRRRPAARP
ncbi:MAG: GIN domain-containing protein [Gemmatimonadota bacterium]